MIAKSTVCEAAVLRVKKKDLSALESRMTHLKRRREMINEEIDEIDAKLLRDTNEYKRLEAEYEVKTNAWWEMWKMRERLLRNDDFDRLWQPQATLPEELYHKQVIVLIPESNQNHVGWYDGHYIDTATYDPHDRDWCHSAVVVEPSYWMTVETYEKFIEENYK